MAQRSPAQASEMLRRLELDVVHRLDGLLHGDHMGLTPGHGSEPGEARVYQAGDDIRRIDWNVTARSNELHVRETIADRELETWIIADRSASLEFGTADWEKRDLVLAAAAGVGFLTVRGGNRIGAVISSQAGTSIVPARGGRRHLLSILDRINSAGERDGAATEPWGDVLRRSSSIARRRGLVAVISDWLDPVDSWRTPLAQLGVRHDVLAVDVVDPRELDIPPVGVLTVIDTETGRTREVDTNSRRTRQAYADAAREQRASIETTITASGAHHVQLSTDRDWLTDLARYVTETKRRKSYAGGASR